MTKNPSKKILEEQYLGRQCRVELKDKPGFYYIGVLEHNHNGVCYEKDWYRCVGNAWNFSFRASHIKTIWDSNKDINEFVRKSYDHDK